MINVGFVYCGAILPAHQGCDRFTASILHYLKRKGGIRITLLIMVDEEVAPSDYDDLCHELIIVKHDTIPLWVRLLDKIIRLPWIEICKRIPTSYWLRRKFIRQMKVSDYLIINYTHWHSIVPKRFRQRTFLLTHDVVYFRLRSFLSEGRWNNFRVWLNRNVEIAILRRFGHIIVLGGYEVDLLLSHGIPRDRMFSIGMPLACDLSYDVSDCVPEFDFAFVGGNSFQNEATLERFMKMYQASSALRATPLSIAVAGRICASAIMERITATHLTVVKFGVVEDVSTIYKNCRLVIGTVPKGSGIKVKIVEAMAHGKPVLATLKALEGIPCTHERDVIVVDNIEAEDQGDYVLNLLHDSPRLFEIGKNARQNIQEVFSEANCFASLLERMGLKEALGTQEP